VPDRSGIRILVIGIGNSLREDDGAGCLVAETLAQRADNRFRCLTVQQLTADLVTDLESAERVIFIDASVNHPPGKIEVSNLSPDGGISACNSHDLTPRDLLTICRTLNGSAPQAVLYEIGGHSFDYGESLSEPVAAAVAKLTGDLLAAR